MKTKLKITVVAIMEAETDHYEDKTPKGAAKETEKALNDGAIAIEELLAFAKSVDIKIVPVK